MEIGGKVVVSLSQAWEGGREGEGRGGEGKLHIYDANHSVPHCR